MLMYEVSREPEIRREVLQLHRCEGIGRVVVGMLKVWVAAPQEQDTVSSRKVSVLAMRLCVSNPAGLYESKISIYGAFLAL